MIDQIFRQVAKELLNRNFIRKFGIDRKIVSDIISTVKFKDQIENMLLEEKYDSKDVYDLMADLINVYPVKNRPDNWLEYFYFYSLNFSFPDAVTIRLGSECNKVAEMYLRVLKIFSELQKSSNDGT